MMMHAQSQLKSSHNDSSLVMTAKIRYNELILGMEALTNMESMKQRMLGGKLYKANDPEISVESQRGSDLVWQFNPFSP